MSSFTTTASAGTVCKRCGGPKPDPRRGPRTPYCTPCVKVRAREAAAARTAARRAAATPEDADRENARAAIRMKLRRWGLTLARCQVCGFSGRLMIEPVGGGRRARWQFYVVHRPCKGRIGDCRVPPIDLLDIDENTGMTWLGVADHAATPSAASE